jgi:hypothetical protein
MPIAPTFYDYLPPVMPRRVAPLERPFVAWGLSLGRPFGAPSRRARSEPHILGAYCGGGRAPPSSCRGASPHWSPRLNETPHKARQGSGAASREARPRALGHAPSIGTACEFEDIRAESHFLKMGPVQLVCVRCCAPTQLAKANWRGL